MKRNSSPYRNVWKLMASVWPFVVCFLVLSLVTIAQTTLAQSKSLFAGRVAERASDLKVSFSYGPKFPTEGQTVQFLDVSTGSPTSWLWEFGDGSTSTEKNPSHKYLTSGFRKVSLLASNRAGSKKSYRTISIMPEMTTASFVFSPTAPGPGQTVQFADTSSGNPTSWQWDFGDGSTSTAKNPSHAYMKAAFYTVTLISSNSSGSKQGSKTITVASMSVLSSSFNYAPALPSAGQAVQFSDSSAGSPRSWQWDFGDGMSSTAQNPVHSFSAAGFYNVTLTVGSGSESKSISRAITITSAAVLDASFTYSPTSPVDGQAILFTDASLGSPASWLWDFADGTSSTSQSPSHTYASPGSYNVILTVTSGSSSDSRSQTINVSPVSVLTAAFVFSPTSPALGQAISFSDTSAGNPTSWDWDFGDGSSSTVQNPTHTYTAAGAQSVTLTVKAGSDASSISKTISVTHADVIQAASASFADVTAAVSIAKAGETVLVPAGRATWNSQLVMTKGIKLIGAGIGQTVITSGYVNSADYLVRYEPADPSSDYAFRFSGFTLNLDENCRGILLIGPTSAYPQTKIRIDHNYMGTSPGRVVCVEGPFCGVVDNNVFAGEAVAAIYGHDGTAWISLTYDYGSANALFFEDNTCTVSDIAFSSGAGGRWVARRNTIYCTAGMYPLFDMHGNQGAGSNDANIASEIYANNVIAGANGVKVIDHRGGKSLVYDNAIATTSFASLQIREEYLDSLNSPEFGPGGQPQHVSSSYYFNNTQNGSAIPASSHTISQTVENGGSIGLVPQWGIDCWRQTTTVIEASGVGVGLLEGRPTSGLTVGVGYWATDVKKLFRWTENNRWEEYYTPYTYPHPLRNR